MISHLDSNTLTTDINPDILSGVQSHDRYNICGIAHAHTKRKDDIFMQRWLGQIFTFGVEARELYIDKAHTVLDIFRFAVFDPQQTSISPPLNKTVGPLAWYFVHNHWWILLQIGHGPNFLAQQIFHTKFFWTKFWNPNLGPKVLV